MSIEGISALSSLSTASISLSRQERFQKADTDSSNGLSLEELFADRQNVPGGNNAQAIEAMFAQADSDSSGELSQSELEAFLSPFDGQTAGALLQAQEQAGGMLSAADRLASLDSDGDGALSEEEFAAGAPDDVSEEQSAQLFASLDADGSGAISEDELAAAAPPPGPPPAQTASSSEESTSYDPLDTNQDGTVSAAEYAAAAQDESDDDETVSTFQSLMQQTLAAYEQTSAFGVDPSVSGVLA